MRKKTIIIILACILLLALGYGVSRKEAGEKADVRYGEDYLDGREKSWEIRDAEGKVLADIKASEDFKLSGQEYGECSITDAKSSLVIGRISVNQGNDLETCVNHLTDGKRHFRQDLATPKGKPYTRISLDGEEYLLAGKGENTLCIRMCNIKKSGMDLKEAGDILISMTDLK